MKTTAQDLAEKFHQADIDFQIVDVRCPMLDARRESSIENRVSKMIKLKGPKAITELPGFAEGLFTVQDITASQPVKILKPQPSWTILDLCAAPGVKTTQLAEATEDSATIIATDIDAERLTKVKENTARLGIKSVDIVRYGERFNLKFDCVLLDVPCSNTGVLAKRIEARYRVTPKAIKKLAKIQSELLDTAAAMIKPHGIICYSTCSIQKEENTSLVNDFLKQNRSFKLEFEKLTLPSTQPFDCDGSYTAILVATE